MKLSNIFVSMLLLAGVAAAASTVVELSGTDPAVFDQLAMQKDGVSSIQLGAEIWGTPVGWDNVNDGMPFGNKSPALLGSLARNARQTQVFFTPIELSAFQARYGNVSPESVLRN